MPKFRLFKLNNFKINTRILALSAITITGFALLMGIVLWGHMVSLESQKKQSSLRQEQALIQDVAENFLHARRREKDFMLRLDEGYITKHAEVSQNIKSELSDLKNIVSSEQDALVDSLLIDYQAYEDQFKVLSDSMVKMGLNQVQVCKVTFVNPFTMLSLRSRGMPRIL